MCDGGNSLRAKPGYWMREISIDYDDNESSQVGKTRNRPDFQAFIFRCQPGENKT